MQIRTKTQVQMGLPIVPSEGSPFSTEEVETTAHWNTPHWKKEYINIYVTSFVAIALEDTQDKSED